MLDSSGFVVPAHMVHRWRLEQSHALCTQAQAQAAWARLLAQHCPGPLPAMLQRLSSADARALLLGALGEGVPLWNAGDLGGCVGCYIGACERCDHRRPPPTARSAAPGAVSPCALPLCPCGRLLCL